MGLFRGVYAPFRGALFVARHGLWAYLVLPVLINIVLAVVSYQVAFTMVAERTGWDGFGGMVLASLVALLVFLAMQPVAGAAFIDPLTEKVEKIVQGEAATTGFFSGTVKAIWHGVLKLGLYAIGLGLTLTLSMFTGIGGILGVGVTAIFLAYDGFDYPLARRDTGFWGKWRYMMRHPGLTLGYAGGATVLFMVPLAVLVAPAFAAVGATLAYLDTRQVAEPKPE